MAYFGGTTGGRLRMRGDPGFFAPLIPLAGALARRGISALAGRAGGRATAAAAGAVIAERGLRAPPGGMIPTPGARGAIQRILPGGETGFEMKKRRRTNFANPRALNRAIRRVEGFGRLVQRSKKSVAKANRALNPSTGRSRVPAGHKTRLTH